MNMREENNFEEIFYEFLKKLEVINGVTLSHCMQAGVYGTNFGEYEKNYIIDDTTEIEGLEGFMFIDSISVGSYGFIEYKDEVESHQFIEVGNLMDGYEGELNVSAITAQPFTNRINLEYTINGNGEEIYSLANNYSFYLELNIYGCFKELDFWRKILYQSYMLFKAGDLIGTFINMFISFESMLRNKTGLGEAYKLNEIYKSYTNSNDAKLPKELHAYRLIRNELLHGGDDLASYLCEQDLLLLLMNICYLHDFKKPFEEVEKTKAIKEAIKKKYKRLNKR